MPFETRKLHPSLACEVLGLRLWEAPQPETVTALRDLWSRCGVLVFRRQALGEAELAAFCALFGPLERTVRTDWASPVVPEIGIISNLKDAQGKPIGGLGDGEIEWHSDQSYMMHPATGAALYALELPPAGRPHGSICAPPMPVCPSGCGMPSRGGAGCSAMSSGSPVIGASTG